MHLGDVHQRSQIYICFRSCSDYICCDTYVRTNFTTELLRWILYLERYAKTLVSRQWHNESQRHPRLGRLCTMPACFHLQKNKKHITAIDAGEDLGSPEFWCMVHDLLSVGRRTVWTYNLCNSALQYLPRCCGTSLQCFSTPALNLHLTSSTVLDSQTQQIW